jgi:hypothetical protein
MTAHPIGIAGDPCPVEPCRGCEGLDALGRRMFQDPGLLELERTLERHPAYPLLKLKEQMSRRPAFMLGSDAGGDATHRSLGFTPDDRQTWSAMTPTAVPLGVATLQRGVPLVPAAATCNDSLGSDLLAELKQIKDLVLTKHCRTKAARSRGRGGKNRKLSVDQRVEELHLKSPEVAEGATLKVIAKIIGCVPGAIPGGTYYETKLKPKRDKMRAERALERSRAENRQAIRDNREHVESYEDVDDHIDATWNERQGGRFAN